MQQTEQEAAPAVAGANKARMYFDSTLKTWMISENGGDYVKMTQEVLEYAISDETTAITTGTDKLISHAPFDFLLFEVIGGLSVVSSSGAPQFDVNKNGSTVFSTPLTIDANEETSITAATPAVLTANPLQFTKGDKISFDIDTAGTGAKGAKVQLIIARN
jgi:hypothetical protein